MNPLQFDMSSSFGARAILGHVTFKEDMLIAVEHIPKQLIKNSGYKSSGSILIVSYLLFLDQRLSVFLKPIEELHVVEPARTCAFFN